MNTFTISPTLADIKGASVSTEEYNDYENFNIREEI